MMVHGLQKDETIKASHKPVICNCPWHHNLYKS